MAGIMTLDEIRAAIQARRDEGCSDGYLYFLRDVEEFLDDLEEEHNL